MPSLDKDYQEVSDFSRGPWHAWGPDVGPAKGFLYDCLNMQVYENGSLGPRPILFGLNVASNDIAITDTSFKGAVMLHMNYEYAYDKGVTNTASLNKVLYLIDGANAAQQRFDFDDYSVSDVTLSNSHTMLTQSLPARYAATPRAEKIQPGTLYYEEVANEKAIIGGEDLVTNFAGVAGSVSVTEDFSYPTNFDPHTCFSFRDRFWAWGDAEWQNRIYYSAIGDHTSWNADNYLQIGADVNKPIIGVWPIYDALWIAMKDMRWYKFTFTDSPGFGEIRYIGTKRIPDYNVHPATPGDSLIFLTQHSGVVVVTKEDIDDMTLSYVRVPSDGEDDPEHYFLRGLEAPEKNALCLPYQKDNLGTFDGASLAASTNYNVHKGDGSIDLVNGVWVRSLYFGPNATDLAPRFIDAFKAGTNAWGFVACDNADDSSTDGEKVYVRDVCLNRPSCNEDGFFVDYMDERGYHLTSSGSANTTSRFSGRLWLGRYRAPQNSLCRIEKVIIEFDYWNDSDFTAPAFTIKADYVHNGDQQSSITVGSLDASALSAQTGYIPKRGRVVIAPAVMAMSSSILIYFEGIKSVAFHNIKVEYSIDSLGTRTAENT